MKADILSVIQFATKIHSGVFRKVTGEPYISHLFSVAGIVSSISDDEDLIAAAFLHDSVEDTDETVITIENLFGKRVATIVNEVTNVATLADGNRAIRFQINKEHVAKASYEGKTLKISDIIDNLKVVLNLDPKRAKNYLDEKEEMLSVLKGGNQKLYIIATNLVETMKGRLCYD